MKIELNELAKVLAQTRGRGLSMKQLAAQLAPGQDVKQQVRKGLAQLIREGRAVTDGQIYRAPSARKPEAQEEPRRPESGRGGGRRPDGRGESRRNGPGGGLPREKGENRRTPTPGHRTHAPNGDGARAPGREPTGRPAAMLEGSRQRRERGSEKAKGPGEMVGTLTPKPEGDGFACPRLL